MSDFVEFSVGPEHPGATIMIELPRADRNAGEQLVARDIDLVEKAEHTL